MLGNKIHIFHKDNVYFTFLAYFLYFSNTAHSFLRQAIPGQTSTSTDIAITTVYVTFPLEFLGF